MKAALVASLAYHPELLVLDEPFAGLDALVREEFTQGILEVAGGDRPWTVFISSHDIDEVERLADWIGVINEGRLELAEPVPSLVARFRRIEAATEGDAALPSPLPASWLLAESSGRTVRFVESGFVESECRARVRDAMPGARDISVTPMSLREIFIVLARAFRLAEPQGGAR
jgi:ABC-2 type transport system ATP-binding protein